VHTPPSVSKTLPVSCLGIEIMCGKSHLRNGSETQILPEKKELERKQLGKCKYESLCLTTTLTVIKILPVG